MSIQGINNQQPIYKSDNQENGKKRLKDKPEIKEVVKTKPTQNDLTAQLAQIDVRNIPETIAKENQSQQEWRNETTGTWGNGTYDV
jgi:hypothetical protein